MPLPYDTNALVAQTQAMLAQTQAQGTMAFKGSSYDTITPQALAPQSPINVQTTPSPTPVVAPQLPPTPVTAPQPLTPTQPSTTDIINQQFTLTPEEQANQQSQSATMRRIAELTGQTSGANIASETARLQSTPEFQAKQQTVNDLTSQFNQLATSAQQIPLQMQQQSIGKGLTTAVGQGLIETELRKNAIQQLGISSMLSAANGNLSLALQQVDRAISAEFDPLKAELTTAQANLDALRNDPNITNAEKKRAAIAQAQLDDRSAALKTREADKQGILDTGLKAAQLGADALTLQAIQASKTAAEAQQVLMMSGLLAPQAAAPDTQIIKLDNGQTVVVDKTTGKVISNIGGAQPIQGGAFGTQSGQGVGGDSEGGTSTYTTDAKGNIIAGDSSLTASAKDWIMQFNSGLMSIEDIYTKIGSAKESLPLRNEVARLVGLQKGKRIFGADDASIQAINSQIKNVNDLLEGGKFGKIVGLVQGGAGFWPDKLNPGKQDALAIAKNLTSNQTLQALADAKAKGITFGALSERELGVVAEAASRIAAKIQRKNKDFPDEITGFSGSEAQFKKDLLTILHGDDGKGGLIGSVASKTLGANTQLKAGATGTTASGVTWSIEPD